MIPSQLQVAVRNLLDEFGSHDSPHTGAVINLSVAAPGLAIYIAHFYYAIPTAAAYAGLAWAILNFAAILKWGLEQ